MEAELKSLEQKINEFVGLCHRLRTENQQLRQQLAAALDRSKHLEDKIESATRRLENLLDQIPEEQA